MIIEAASETIYINFTEGVVRETSTEQTHIIAANLAWCNDPCFGDEHISDSV